MRCARCDRELSPTGARWHEARTETEVCWACGMREIERSLALRYVPPYRGVPS